MAAHRVSLFEFVRCGPQESFVNLVIIGSDLSELRNSRCYCLGGMNLTETRPQDAFGFVGVD